MDITVALLVMNTLRAAIVEEVDRRMSEIHLSGFP